MIVETFTQSEWEVYNPYKPLQSRDSFRIIDKHHNTLSHKLYISRILITVLVYFVAFSHFFSRSDNNIMYYFVHTRRRLQKLSEDTNTPRRHSVFITSSPPPLFIFTSLAASLHLKFAKQRNNKFLITERKKQQEIIIKYSMSVTNINRSLCHLTNMTIVQLLEILPVDPFVAFGFFILIFLSLCDKVLFIAYIII